MEKLVASRKASVLLHNGGGSKSLAFCGMQICSICTILCACVFCVVYFDMFMRIARDYSPGLVINAAAGRPVSHLSAADAEERATVSSHGGGSVNSSTSMEAGVGIPINAGSPAPGAASQSESADESAANGQGIRGGAAQISGQELQEAQVNAQGDGGEAGGNRGRGSPPSKCSLFEGRWVFDESYPLYRSESCPFIDDGFRCQENGRPDTAYMKWRWQPRGCDLPRFDAKAMLERLRGKRVVFVGDSIGRNQWESMLCILAEGVPADRRRAGGIYEVNGESITKHTGFLSFRFRDYNFTVEYYRSPFLVPQTRPPSSRPANVSSVLRVDAMDWSSKHWSSADVLIFNTGHWWSYEKIMRGGVYFQIGSRVNVSLDLRSGFSRSLRTWREWVGAHVDLRKTVVFFRTYAPAHFSGGTWKTGGTCHQETEPYGTTSDVFEEEAELETPWTNAYVATEVERVRDRARHVAGSAGVHLLDITHLSNYRKDAHASIYHVGSDQPRPMHRQDCSHWCLPGLPDTWNELVFATLLQTSATSSARGEQ